MTRPNLALRFDDDPPPAAPPALALAGETAGPGDAGPAPTGAVHGFSRCAAAIHRFLMVRTSSDAHLCDDLMQQLWLAAANQGGRVPVAQAEYWLRRVARNLLHSHYRRLGRQPIRLDPAFGSELADRLSAAPLAPEALVQAEVHQAMLLALTELDTDDQEILLAHYAHGLSHAAIAERLGASARAVEGRLYRARLALRATLDRPPNPPTPPTPDEPPV